MAKKMRFIFVSGGVISSLGKGVTTASIALLLKSRGFKVAVVKCETYMNVDSGTIRPTKHGEVYVTEDGVETDQDLGTYERFIDENLGRENFITNGQIYKTIIERERNFGYEGEDVEIVPHVPEEMIRRFKEAGKKAEADFVIIEIGGTVGEYQNVLFIEANRIMKYRDHEEVIHVHLGYLPTPPSVGEMKSKPMQTSVRTLSATGIQPDFLIGRAETDMDEPRKQRLSWLCNVDEGNIFSNPDVDLIYKIPIILESQGIVDKILRKFKISPIKKDLKPWKKLVEDIGNVKKEIKIAIVGKYFQTGDYMVADSYVSVIEALRHAGWHQEMNMKIEYINAEDLEKTPNDIKKLKNYQGVVVPQGWGKRGVEGKINAIKYLREHKIPFLGLCFGMQMAVIEFARNVCGYDNANSEEINKSTGYPVIHIMPEQVEYIKKHQYGGTIRLGAYPCKLNPKSQIFKAYDGKDIIFERHRHRYEFNNKYREQLEAKGLIIAGTSPDGKLVEAVELSRDKHPFFVATQFHPEYKSRFMTPHPIFSAFIKVAGRK